MRWSVIENPRTVHGESGSYDADVLPIRARILRVTNGSGDGEERREKGPEDVGDISKSIYRDTIPAKLPFMDLARVSLVQNRQRPMCVSIEIVPFFPPSLFALVYSCV